MFCGEHTLISASATAHTATPLYCRSWTCEDCAPKRVRRLRDEAAAGAPTRFITLTSRLGHQDDADAAARALVHAWRMVVQRAKREGIIKDIQYLCVFEGTQREWPHLHILARCAYIPQDWLSQRMGEYLDSPNVWITRIKTNHAASRYIAKYAAKGPRRFKGCKRYWRTANYFVGPTGWERDAPVHDAMGLAVKRPLPSVAYQYELQGWAVEWQSATAFKATDSTLVRAPPYYTLWCYHHQGLPNSLTPAADEIGSWGIH